MTLAVFAEYHFSNVVDWITIIKYDSDPHDFEKLSLHYDRDLLGGKPGWPARHKAWLHPSVRLCDILIVDKSF